jgi:hypothetical protein
MMAMKRQHDDLADDTQYTADDFKRHTGVTCSASPALHNLRTGQMSYTDY